MDTLGCAIPSVGPRLPAALSTSVHPLDRGAIRGIASELEGDAAARDDRGVPGARLGGART